jgi:thioredoxin reductase
LSLRDVADVTLVHRRDALSALAYTRERLRESGVRLLTNAEVVGLAAGVARRRRLARG